MKQRITVFVAGLLTGAALLGGGAAFAAGILAEHAPQTAYVDGAPVQLEAYNIGGYNYVKLRDIGQAVGFNVYWDGQSVQMDSDAPYTGTGPTQGTTTVGSIEVGGFQGTTLKVGGRTPLIISPNTPQDVITSSHPAILAVENVMGHWTVLAKSPGTAIITVTAPDGRTGSTTFTVVPADPASTVDLNANMEIRLEMVRLINEVRRANGVAELPVSDALMNAAQAFSAKRYINHNTKEECELVSYYGYSHGFNNNLAVLRGVAMEDIAHQTVTSWVNSPGHFQAMIDPACDCIGIGVTIVGGTTYCQMFAGDSNSHMPYE